MKINKIKTFGEYEYYARQTDLIDDLQGLDPRWVYYILGLNGEVGELTECAKKLFRDYRGKMDIGQKNALVKEAGDVLWYLTRLCNYLEIKMEDIATLNAQKLQRRMDAGKIHGSGDDR